eukprot:11449012-Ditylum_brightwellii.AAC.1
MLLVLGAGMWGPGSGAGTQQKAIANTILKSDVANDPNGCWFLYMDNRYAAPQLFAIMATN